MGVCAKEHPILGGWPIWRYPYVRTHISLSLSLSLSLALVSICLSVYLSTNLVQTHMGHHFHPRISRLNMAVHVMSFFLLPACPTTNDNDNNAVKPTIQIQTTQFLRYPWEARQGRGGEGREEEDLGGGQSGVSEDYEPWNDVFMDDAWMNGWMVGFSHPWRLNLKVYKILWTKSNVDGWGRTRSKVVLEDYEPWNYIFVDG